MLLGPIGQKDIVEFQALGCVNGHQDNVIFLRPVFSLRDALHEGHPVEIRSQILLFGQVRDKGFQIIQTPGASGASENM